MLEGGPSAGRSPSPAPASGVSDGWPSAGGCRSRAPHESRADERRRARSGQYGLDSVGHPARRLARAAHPDSDRCPTTRSVPWSICSCGSAGSSRRRRPQAPPGRPPSNGAMSSKRSYEREDWIRTRSLGCAGRRCHRGSVTRHPPQRGPTDHRQASRELHTHPYVGARRCPARPPGSPPRTPWPSRSRGRRAPRARPQGSGGPRLRRAGGLGPVHDGPTRRTSRLSARRSSASSRRAPGGRGTSQDPRRAA